MRLALVLAVTALAAPAFAQESGDEASEGTFSTYSADEARVAVDVEVPAEPGVAPVAGDQGSLLDTFFRELSPHGRWEQIFPHGWVWYPNEPSFRPYANGGWSYTTEGWTFVSDAPYGWAVYHYGRWAYLAGGWGWIPGYEWSPAWVSIRVNDGYIGWSPLGPGGQVYDFQPAGWTYPYSPWVFVPTSAFGSYPVGTVVLDAGRAQVAFHASAAVPCHHHRPVYREIPRVHHARPVRLVESSAPSHPGHRHGSSVTVYRPRPSAGQWGAPSHSAGPAVGPWDHAGHRDRGHRHGSSAGAPVAPPTSEPARRPGVYGGSVGTGHSAGVGVGVSTGQARPPGVYGVPPSRPTHSGAGGRSQGTHSAGAPSRERRH